MKDLTTTPDQAELSQAVFRIVGYLDDYSKEKANPKPKLPAPSDEKRNRRGGYPTLLKAASIVEREARPASELSNPLASRVMALLMPTPPKADTPQPLPNPEPSVWLTVNYLRLLAVFLSMAEPDPFARFLRSLEPHPSTELVVKLVREWCLLHSVLPSKARVGQERSPTPLSRFVIAACSTIKNGELPKGLSRRTIYNRMTEVKGILASKYE